MNIGIDIDGVIVDTEKYVRENGAKFFLKEIENDPNLEVSQILSSSKEKNEIFWKNHSVDYNTLAPLRENAREYIKKLHEEGNKIFIITGRKPHEEHLILTKQNYKATTRNYLLENGIIFDEIVHDEYPKTKAVKRLKIDVMIEDSPICAEGLKEITKVILLDTKANREYESEKVRRANSWTEIYDILKTL